MDQLYKFFERKGLILYHKYTVQMKIAVSRLEEKSEGTIELFARYGHEAVLVPTMKAQPASDPSMELLCDSLSKQEVDFLIFSSTLGVKYFFEICSSIPDNTVIVSVGPITSQAIIEKGFICETISSFTSDHFASHLGSRIRGKTVGIVRPDVPNPGLVETLSSQDARVLEGIAYRLLPAGNDMQKALKDVDAVIFTSGKSFAFARVNLQDLHDKKVIAIGPKTAAAMKKAGVEPDLVGDGTLEGCLKNLGHSR